MGYTREEAVGRHFSIFYLPDDQAAEQPQHLLAAALEKGRAAHEGWHQRKDGSRFWAEATLTSVSDENGNLVGFAKVTRDRSERRAYEQQRQHAEQELRALNADLEQRVRERTAELEERHRELETFTYSVSHDLKAPLRGIDGYSRLLQEDYSDRLDEEGRRFLATIRRATQQMSQLIEDLLAYSRLERRKLQVSPVSPAALVAAILAEYADEIRRRSVAVTVALPEVTLKIDPEGLAMVLRNLIDNALKFTGTAAEPRVDVGGSVDAAVCRLWVRDNGVGFDMKYHDRIFEIFQRLHREEEYPGTGVGLAIVRKAIERMGGRVWARSEPGVSTTFYVELPWAGNEEQ